MKPPAVRQAARNNMGAMSLWVRSRIHGTRFWAKKPPRLPTELIAAKPAAAAAPFRKVEGSDQNTGWAANIPDAATHNKANLMALPGTNTLAARHAAPMNAGSAMCQVCSPVRAACRGTHHSDQATQAQGITLRKPLTVLVTPKPFTTVGSQ